MGLALVLLVACHREPTPTLGNHATASPPPDAQPEQTGCARYDALVERAVRCQGLSAEVRQQIKQDQTDTHASIVESGMDGGERVDPDRTCDDASAKLEQTAAVPCGW